MAALFVDPEGEAGLTALWNEVSGDARPFGEVADEAKREQASGPFTPEVERLRRLHDRDDLVEALSSLPVYRTYIRDGEVAAEDAEILREAGIEWLPETPPEFVTRFQQTTPPVMAKGVEDTAFYRYGRLLALNDVGGDPSRFGISVDDVPRRQPRARRALPAQPAGDADARHQALGRRAGAHRRAGRHGRGRGRRTCGTWLALLEDVPGPDGAERYFIFQTLVGAWPIEPERLEAYMEKAMREAKRNTNWIEPDEAHEAAVKAFCRGLYEHEAFLADFEPFADEVARAGERSALGQLLLKLTVPGLPDIYNGDELRSLSLVDPDNRRPVDWDARRAALAALGRGAERTRHVKLLVIQRALALRAKRPEAFAGAYTPIDGGDAGVRVRARRRRGARRRAGPRPGSHGATLDLGELAGPWRDVLSGAMRELSRRTQVSELTSPHGLALLERL